APRHPPGARGRGRCAADHRRRGRPGVRIRRFPRARPLAARAAGGRVPRRHDRRRLWRGPGRHLQHPRPGPRSACQGWRMGLGAAAGDSRGADRARPPAALALTPIMPVLVTVRDFEAGRREPTRNNLTAMKAALESVGISFVEGPKSWEFRPVRASRWTGWELDLGSPRWIPKSGTQPRPVTH